MDSYRVQVDGVTVATYSEFERAGRSGVRGVASGEPTQEYSGRTAHSLACETAEAMLSRGNVRVLRGDGTVAAEWR